MEESQLIIGNAEDEYKCRKPAHLNIYVLFSTFA
jgi:hypothetical protein